MTEEIALARKRYNVLDFLFDTLHEHETLFNSLVERLDESVNKVEFTLIENRLARELEEKAKYDALLSRTKHLEAQVEMYKEKIEILQKHIESINNSIIHSQVPE
jgi:hypothetical protein